MSEAVGVEGIVPGTPSSAGNDPTTARRLKALKLALLSALIVASFPGMTSAIRTGLDPSWQIALQELRPLGVTWGRDVAFTVGPLGFVAVGYSDGRAEPGVWLARAVGYLLWWGSIAALLGRFGDGRSMLGFALPTLLLGGFLANSPVVTLSLSCPSLLAAARLRDRLGLVPVVAALCAASLLVKFNLGIAGLGCLGGYVLGLVLDGDWRGAITRGALAASAFFATLAGLFHGFGGTLRALPDFLEASWEFATAYSSQMALSSPTDRQFLAIAGLLGIALLALLIRHRRNRPFRDVALIVAPAFFFAFKGAIVRNDVPHVLHELNVVLGLLILLIAAAPALAAPRKLSGIAAVACVAIQMTQPLPWCEDYPLEGPKNVRSLICWPQRSAALRGAFEEFRRAEALPRSWLERIGRRPVDAYPARIDQAVANGLAWRPRFALQSYATYTPALDAASARQFEGPDAVPWVLYRHEAINNQHPCGTDSRTWLELYRWYEPEAETDDGETLLLGLRDRPRFEGTEILESAEAGFGQRLEVPITGGDPVILRARLRPTAAGSLRETLYKLFPPDLRIEYRDGSVRTYRAVWRNLAGGLLISDLPRDLEAASRLLSGGLGDPVAAVTIVGEGRWFEPTFPVTFERLPRTADRSP